MLADFSFIIVRGGATIHDKRDLVKFLYTILSYIDATEVTEEEFDKSYDMIPRVVVQHSKEVKEIQDRIARGELDAKNVSLNKLQFKEFDTKQKSISHVRQSTDPRYGIIDAHIIDAGAGEMLVLNIAVNTMNDARVKTWMNIGLASKLNVGKSHDVIAIITDPKSGKQIECYDINTLNGKKFKRSTVGHGSNAALSGYKTETGIDIKKVLQGVDKNVDITDATDTIKDINNILARMQESIEFMKKGDFDKPSIEQAKSELRDILTVRQRYLDLQKEQSTLTSIYFRMNSPTKLGGLIKTTAQRVDLEIAKIKDVSDM